MKRITISLLLGALLFIGCDSEDDPVGSTAASCDGTFDPSGYTFVGTDAQLYIGTEECGDATITPMDVTANYASNSYVFDADGSVVLYSGTMLIGTYDWCVTGTTLSLSSYGANVGNWTMTANDAATGEEIMPAGCFTSGGVDTGEAEADCSETWTDGRCTAVTYAATLTPAQ